MVWVPSAQADHAGKMHITVRIFAYIALCLWMSCCTGSAVQPLEAYQVPWTAKINGKLWVFETAPLASRPQPTRSQTFSNSWAFAGGPGVILVALYEDTPLLNGKTSYSELVYIPGRYRPCRNSQDAYYSVAQMFVDDLHARGAGRTVWGYPKEMARFTWATSGPSMQLRVHRQGSLIFSANFTDSASSSPFLPAWLISGQRTIQVPIPRNASDPSALVLSRVEYSFSAGLPTQAAVSGWFADAAAFTNNTALRVTPLAATEVVRFPLGASGWLPAPTPFKCAANTVG